MKAFIASLSYVRLLRRPFQRHFLTMREIKTADERQKAQQQFIEARL